MKFNVYKHIEQVEAPSLSAVMLALAASPHDGHLFVIDADDLTDCDAPQEAELCCVSRVDDAVVITRGVMPQ